MEQRAFNISFIILTKEISKLIKSLLNGKAPRLNGIPNEAFKAVVLVIAKNLAKAASYCFTNKTIPKSLKEFITVVLHKKKKLFFPKQLQTNCF